MKPDSRRPGLTLIELLVVMMIVGVLASLAIARHQQLNRRAFQVALEADMAHLALQQELFFHRHTRYAALEELVDFQASDGVMPQVTWVGTGGFALLATHDYVPGVVCGYYVGSPPNGAAGPAAVPSKVSCE